MKTVLLAPDSFKGCLSSAEVCAALEIGLKKSYHDIKTLAFPSSDGGEGFCACMQNLFGGSLITHPSFDPLGREIETSFIYNEDNKTAYIELAAASGLTLINEHERDIMRSSTYGTGVSVLKAIRLGAKTVYIGLGGSATNDCGMGLLSALGASFYDKDGVLLAPSAFNMSKVAYSDYSALRENIKDISFIAACDVKNRLCGKDGAAYVFARQKGASDEEVAFLDKALESFSLSASIDKDLDGAGAAGGTGAALRSVLHAEYVSGASLLVGSDKFKNALTVCDAVITGEGNTDSQSCFGKLVSVVANACKTACKRCIVISGGLSGDYNALKTCGVSEFHSLTDKHHSVAFCIDNAREMLAFRASECLFD